MKAVLVMETLECCEEYKFLDNKQECILQDEVDNLLSDTFEELKESCPLKPMPEKKYWKPSSGITLQMYGTGWNACIDEIIGGEE